MEIDKSSEMLRVLIMKFFATKNEPLEEDEGVSQLSSKFKEFSKEEITAEVKLLASESKIQKVEYDIDGSVVSLYWLGAVEIPKSEENKKVKEDDHREELINDIKSGREELRKVEQEIAAHKQKYKVEYNAHMDRLHRYNEIKDVGQSLIGQLAQINGVRTKDLYPQFKLDLED